MSEPTLNYPRNQEFRSQVQKSDNGKFEVTIYQWDASQTDKEGNILWTRIAGPFVFDAEEQATEFAQVQLNLFSGEECDPSVDKSLVDFIAEILGHENFIFFKPENYKINHQEDPKPIKGEKVLCIDDIFLVEYDKKWKIGYLEKVGEIRTFLTLPHLEKALEKIQNLE